MKIVPLNRAHRRQAAALHREGVVWAYRGRADRATLFWFYDACANRDFTVAAVALEDDRVVGAACAATAPAAGTAWLKRRRRWRSLVARLHAGPDLARGGWPEGRLRELGADAALVLSFVTAPEVDAAGRRALIGALAAAAASHGARRLAAGGGAGEGWPSVSFWPQGGGTNFYERVL